MLRAAAAVLAVLTLAACATTEESVPVSYSAVAASPIAGAERITVTVRAADARTANRGRISTKKNGYGMEMAAIRLQGDVAEVVRDALASELKARGYRLGAGGPVVSAAVEAFYNDFKVGAFAGRAESDVQLTVAVADAGGGERYRRTLAGKAAKTVQLASGKNAAASLSAALSDAIGKLMADPAFTAALAR